MELMAGPLVAAERGESALLSGFDAWMLSEQRRVFGLCQRFLRDRDEADSATQDVFLKAYQALRKEDAQTLDDPARWLTRIAVNTSFERKDAHAFYERLGYTRNGFRFVKNPSAAPRTC